MICIRGSESATISRTEGPWISSKRLSTSASPLEVDGISYSGQMIDELSLQGQHYFGLYAPARRPLHSDLRASPMITTRPPEAFLGRKHGFSKEVRLVGCQD